MVRQEMWIKVHDILKSHVESDVIACELADSIVDKVIEYLDKQASLKQEDTNIAGCSTHKFVYVCKEQIAGYTNAYYYNDIVICEKCGLVKRYKSEVGFR